MTPEPKSDLLELITLAHNRAEVGADRAGCDGWRAQELCRQIERLLSQALLSLNKEGKS